MKRIRIAVVAIVAVGSIGLALGARAMMSAEQQYCLDVGGTWTDNVYYDETSPGHFEGYVVGECFTPAYEPGDANITTYFIDGKHAATCHDYPGDSQDVCNFKPQQQSEPQPTGTSTSTMGDPRTNTTGSYQQQPAPTTAPTIGTAPNTRR
jgi:hypothetical protein